MNRGRRWPTTVLGAATLVAVLALLALGTLPEQDMLAQGNTIYVDADATGANDGTSWEDAYTALQPALAGAAGGEEIWVAEGTCTPTYLFSPGDPRSATVQLKNGVALYSGFDPTVGETGWDDRDWLNNVTILSGDIGTVDDPGDNSFHVFYHPAELALNGSAVIDGFTLTGANCKWQQSPRWRWWHAQLSLFAISDQLHLLEQLGRLLRRWDGKLLLLASCQ